MSQESTNDANATAEGAPDLVPAENPAVPVAAPPTLTHTEPTEHQQQQQPTTDQPIPTSVPSVPEIENKFLLNLPDNPNPQVFKVTEADLSAHKAYVERVPLKQEPRVPELKPFVDTDKPNIYNDAYEFTDTDPAGEKKISSNGSLNGGRKFLFTTFTLPGRGNRLYALATDVARSLSFRDSFMFFMKNRKIFKYSCNDKERKFLEDSGFSISKVKSRSVTVLSVRSLFVHFGARVILQGKRIVDDYWEEQLKEQGFTENDPVFPAPKRIKQKRSKPQNSAMKKSLLDPKVRLKLPTVTLVNALPSLEDRKEYLTSSSNGLQTQVLPGQGITGGLELATVASIPKYGNEHANPVKQKHILNNLASTTPQSVSSLLSLGNTLVTDNKLAGKRTPNGLPYYNTSVTKRLATEDYDKLQEIEYLHGTVETNHLITVGRNARNRQWAYYWQVKSGAPFGLTKETFNDFSKDSENFINEVQTETTYNEYLRCDQIISKKRKPNPNFLGYGNINGLKAPYLEKPHSTEPVEPNPNFSSGIPPHMGYQQ